MISTEKERFVHRLDILVATTHIVNRPDPKTMSKNKKKKLKKKEKQKQKMLELTQQQIQVKYQKSFLLDMMRQMCCFVGR